MIVKDLIALISLISFGYFVLMIGSFPLNLCPAGKFSLGVFL